MAKRKSKLISEEVGENHEVDKYNHPEIRVQKLNEIAKLPTRNCDSAGLDLYVTSVCPVSGSSGTILDGHKEVNCQSNRIYVAETGIAVEMPAGYFGLIKPRSGLSLRHGMMVGAGVIDNDYRGEIKVIFTVENNLSVKAGDKIAQLVLLPYLGVEVIEVEDLSASERGESGFGSSGK